jgi:hypothetical protein
VHGEHGNRPGVTLSRTPPACGRAGPPASDASVLSAFGLLPRHAPSLPTGARSTQLNGWRYRRSPSHGPCKSRRPGSHRLRAGHRLARTRALARLYHGVTTRSPAFDATQLLTTLQQRPPAGLPAGASGSSPWSPPDAIRAPFPCPSPRRSSANAAQGGLTPAPIGRRRRAIVLHLSHSTASEVVSYMTPLQRSWRTAVPNPGLGSAEQYGAGCAHTTP